MFISDDQLMDGRQTLPVGDDFARRLLFVPGATVGPEETVVEFDWPQEPNGDDLYVVNDDGLIAAFHPAFAPPKGRRRGTLWDAWYWYTPVKETKGRIVRLQVHSCEMESLAPGSRTYEPVPGTGQVRDVKTSPERFESPPKAPDRFTLETGIVAYVDPSASA